MRIKDRFYDWVGYLLFSHSILIHCYQEILHYALLKNHVLHCKYFTSSLIIIMDSLCSEVFTLFCIQFYPSVFLNHGEFFFYLYYTTILLFHIFTMYFDSTLWDQNFSFLKAFCFDMDRAYLWKACFNMGGAYLWLYISFHLSN